MLIKNDFDQIRTIVREDVGNEAESVKDDLGSDIRMSRIRIQEDIEELKDRIKNLEIRMVRSNNEDIEKEDDL